MRNFPNWIEAYIAYTGFSEAPRKMHFFAGASAIAGALQRHVWVKPSHHYMWHPNLYNILVAPPGVVSKSTTAAIGMNLLRRVPGVTFGPNIVTWQALVDAFRDSCSSFDVGNEVQEIQCAITIESSELGNLIDPQNRDMIDLLVNLWDGKTVDKVTKTAGNAKVENPWINLIGCTTPAWLAGTFPDYVIGGGLTSRCLFIYADKKERLVAYPILHEPPGMAEMEDALVEDLTKISLLRGPYELTPDAITWGDTWYKELHTSMAPTLGDAFANYWARKQTHIHKIAMVLQASQGDSMRIEAQTLFDANKMVTSLETDMGKVFGRIGRSEDSVHADQLINFVHAKSPVHISIVYQFVHSAFPYVRDFEGIFTGAIQAGYIKFDKPTSMVSAGIKKD